MSTRMGTSIETDYRQTDRKSEREGSRERGKTGNDKNDLHVVSADPWISGMLETRLTTLTTQKKCRNKYFVARI